MSHQPQATSPSCHAKPVHPVVKYLPIIYATGLVLLLTFGRTVYQSRGGGMVMANHVMDSFMAFFFLVYGLPKFINLPAFASSIARYDIIAQKFPVYGYIYPLIEVVLGLLYLVGASTGSFAHSFALNGFVMAFCLINIIGITKGLRAKQDMSCACLGTSFNVPLSKITVLENVVMFAMAAGMIAGFGAMAM